LRSRQIDVPADQPQHQHLQNDGHLSSEVCVSTVRSREHRIGTSITQSLLSAETTPQPLLSLMRTLAPKYSSRPTLLGQSPLRSRSQAVTNRQRPFLELFVQRMGSISVGSFSASVCSINMTRSF
jgi:hypothetical protein